MAMVQQEQRDRLWVIARRELTEDQWHALWFHYAQEMPVAEVAQVMDRTPQNIRVLLFRARQSLIPHAAHIEGVRVHQPATLQAEEQS
jgi:RNA polymerase sigma-70 factor (ECF subfamily)